MAITTTDPVFKECRIAALVQHFFIIIRFQESSMALFEIMYQLIAGLSYICKYTDIGLSCTDYKTMGIAGIMFFLKSGDTQPADYHWLLGSKMKNKFPDFPEAGFL